MLTNALSVAAAKEDEQLTRENSTRSAVGGEPAQPGAAVSNNISKFKVSVANAKPAAQQQRENSNAGGAAAPASGSSTRPFWRVAFAPTHHHSLGSGAAGAVGRPSAGAFFTFHHHHSSSNNSSSNNADQGRTWLGLPGTTNHHHRSSSSAGGDDGDGSVSGISDNSAGATTIISVRPIGVIHGGEGESAGSSFDVVSEGMPRSRLPSVRSVGSLVMVNSPDSRRHRPFSAAFGTGSGSGAQTAVDGAASPAATPLARSVNLCDLDGCRASSGVDTPTSAATTLTFPSVSTATPTMTNEGRSRGGTPAAAAAGVAQGAAHGRPPLGGFSTHHQPHNDGGARSPGSTTGGRRHSGAQMETPKSVTSSGGNSAATTTSTTRRVYEVSALPPGARSAINFRVAAPDSIVGLSDIRWDARSHGIDGRAGGAGPAFINSAVAALLRALRNGFDDVPPTPPNSENDDDDEVGDSRSRLDASSTVRYEDEEHAHSSSPRSTASRMTDGGEYDVGLGPHDGPYGSSTRLEHPSMSSRRAATGLRSSFFGRPSRRFAAAVDAEMLPRPDLSSRHHHHHNVEPPQWASAAWRNQSARFATSAVLGRGDPLSVSGGHPALSSSNVFSVRRALLEDDSRGATPSALDEEAAAAAAYPPVDPLVNAATTAAFRRSPPSPSGATSCRLTHRDSIHRATADLRSPPSMFY